MPDFILADHCIFCGKVLYNPPTCCEAAKDDYSEYFLGELIDDNFYPYVDPPCALCGCKDYPCYCELGVVD